MCYNLNGDVMKTIKNIENITIVNKSKFITNLFSVDNIDDVDKYMSIIKNKYKDATHHCYAYIIDNIKRFNDDGEPSGTAGMPILDILEKNDLNHILCIVTRYFGGIKLGASGLLRAYSNSVKNAINSTSTLELIDGFMVEISFEYSRVKEIDKLLENFEIINKSFDNSITYTALVDKNILDKLENISNLKIMDNIIIKK